jgi:hypothetical protein
MTKDEAREILQKLSNGVLTFMEAEAIECAIQALGDGWIRVEDGLPEPSQRIIVQKQNGLVCEMWFNSDKQFMYNASNQTSQIIYWQPLPSPPKPKQP